MRLLRVAAVSVNQTPLDWHGNIERIIKGIKEAKEKKVSLAVFPELSISGYGLEDYFFSKDALKRSLEGLKKISSHTEGMAISVGLPIQYQKNIYNGAAFISNGEVKGIVLKTHLAGDGIHYEPRWFKPWKVGESALFSSDEFKYGIPIGDIYFSTSYGNIGFEICEDAWVANRNGNSLSMVADIIVNPSASHFSIDKAKVRENLISDASRRFGCAYIYANLLGNESGKAIYDGGNIIAGRGRILKKGKRLSFKDVVVDVCDIDLDKVSHGFTKTFSNESPTFSSKKVEVDAPFGNRSLVGAMMRGDLEEIEDNKEKDLTSEEEFLRASSLGLFDYMRKSKQSGFTLSLSGGADSSIVAALATLSWQMAYRELGPKEFLDCISYSSRLTSAFQKSFLEFSRAILTTVYQKTENSSEKTLNAAKALAKELNATFHEFDITPLLKHYTALVSSALGKDLGWEAALDDKITDLALQNLQARVRSPGVWMLANLSNAILLTTGNRSEIAVGYMTMDGDTSGSLNPIAGVSKPFIKKMLHWLSSQTVFYKENGAESKKIEIISKISNFEPSAELKPLKSNQKDEDDLMPYEILDEIERNLVLEKRSPSEAFISIFMKHKINIENLVTYIEKMYSLFAKNQWKRERLAPSFHLHDRNLDPRSWLRFPILTSAFSEEIEDMKKIANIIKKRTENKGKVDL